MSEINTKKSSFALIIGHMAGMIDLAALPVWVGTLIAGYHFLPSQAGGLATLFLIGVVLCNLTLAPLFHKTNGRWLAPFGFAVSAMAFAGMTQVTAFVPLAVLHLVAGIGAGVGISLTHGAMGLAANPHRIFAMASLALGVIAVVYLGVTPQLIAQSGPSMVFVVFATVMGFAAVVHLIFFPNTRPQQIVTTSHGKLPVQLWFLIAGIMGMALNNAMILSFAERAGVDFGFGPERTQFALMVMGIVAILPAILAAMLQNRFSAKWVAPAGAILHGSCSLALMAATSFTGFMGPLIFLPFIMIFTHTFLFGHMAKLDPTGRAVAATPAMVMTGSAIGPLLGGTIVQLAGYAALGTAAFIIAVLAVLAFTRSFARTPAVAHV